MIKGGSSHEIHKIRGSKMQIWQSGFHESRVTDDAGYKKKVDYVRFNPVAVKLVERPQDWPFGSACGKYHLDPIPQRLKPLISQSLNVGPKGPTPKGTLAASALDPLPPKFLQEASEAKALIATPITPGLKPRPPKENPTRIPHPESEGPTSKTALAESKALKLRVIKESRA